MKVVYICGRFRGKSSWEIECNVRAAEQCALEVWSMGFAVICPHTNTRFFDKALPDDVWLAGDMELLTRADIVYCIEPMNRKYHSSGVAAELELAKNLDKPIIWSLSGLAALKE